jgi:hypothetical protein
VQQWDKPWTYIGIEMGQELTICPKYEHGELQLDNNILTGIAIF